MSVVTRTPTANQSPDATLGGNAVTNISNTGHDSTTTNSFANNGASDADEKSARWFTFTQNPVSGLRTSVKLKMSWLASGSVSALDDGSGGSGQGTADFLLEYSLNGGSNWNTVTSNSIIADAPGNGSDSFTNNNSADISLPLTQDITQVQVRVDYNTTALSSGLGNTGSGSLTVTISAIQIEITLSDATFLD